MAQFPPAALTEEQFDAFFPLERPGPVKHDAYEVALVLGGTVSAGAYTAGVLDYLIEALDAWTLAKHTGDADAPPHELVISTIAGASGGAVNGAIFARAMSWSFPHGESESNPFYNLWINRVQLKELLSSSPDADKSIAPGFSSVLNTSSFVRMANDIITWTGARLGGDGVTPVARGYLADPLRLFMTVTNLTGTPYHIALRGEARLGHDMKTHSDHVRFGLSVPGGAPNRKGDRPDEFALSPAAVENWTSLKDAALATCAFPLAFPARSVQRTAESIAYRVTLVPGDGTAKPERVQLIPNWDAMKDPQQPPAGLRTINIDGGAMNNEPLDLAHTALAGLNGRNPRNGLKADRGIVLVDPFCDGAKADLFEPVGVFGLFLPLLGTLMNQPRFRPADIALAGAENVFSRFLVAPAGAGSGQRPGKIEGEDAIASGGLGGFIGFVHPELLKYDFRLGRRNAHSFLKNHFALPENHPIFKSWSEDQKKKHEAGGSFANPETKKPERFLRLIPLMKPLLDNPPPEQDTTRWPRGHAKPNELREPMDKRLDAAFNAFRSELRAKNKWPGTIASTAIDLAWKSFLRGFLSGLAIDKIRDGLKAKGLL